MPRQEHGQTVIIRTAESIPIAYLYLSLVQYRPLNHRHASTYYIFIYFFYPIRFFELFFIYVFIFIWHIYTNVFLFPSPLRVLTPSRLTQPRPVKCKPVLTNVLARPPRGWNLKLKEWACALPGITVTAPSGRRLSDEPITPLINVDGVESSTNELPLSAITFGSRGNEGGASAGRVASWPRLAGAGCSVWAAGRRQRHSIAGQMSYLKMLGLGARGKLSAAAGLFSTAVISGSSSAPNLRDMIPTASSTNGNLYFISCLFCLPFRILCYSKVMRSKAQRFK